MEKKEKVEHMESKKKEYNEAKRIESHEESIPSTKQWAVENKVLLIAIIGIAILAFVLWNGSISSLLTNDIVVTVNGNGITQQQLQEEIAKVPAYYFSMMDNATIQSAILDQLIARELLLEKATAMGITVTEQEVEVALANVTEQAQMTSEEFLTRLEEEGMTLDEVKVLLKDQITINKVIESEVLKNIQITGEEIQAYYDNATESLVQVQASHILICYTGATRCEQNRTEEEAYTQAQNIIAQLKEGVIFGDLAKEYSDDPSAQSNNGELGWFSKGQMVPEFENAVFTMNIGEISEDPIQTEYGYHIIMVTDKKDSFEDFKDEITAQLTGEKQKAAAEEYLTTLKAAADIQYN
ncbi:MAG: peptidylprolyl isomerase [Candidatus Woesearchaeota archaeon]|jgi:parvulin-like peptidyl-prolyl isomerase